MRSDVKQEFLSAVCAFVRFRPARAGIARELSAHIDDLAAQKQTQGLEKDEALAAAVSEMGDPAEVGKSLDSAHRPRIEWTVAALALLLVGIGLAVQWMLTQSAPQIYVSFPYVLLYTVVGFAVLFPAYLYAPVALRRLPWVFFAFFIALLASLFIKIPNRAIPINAYYIVLLLVPVYAAILERLRKLRGWGIGLACVVCGFVALFLLALPHALATLVWGLCCVVLLTSAIARGRFDVNKRKALLLIYGAGILFAVSALFLLIDGRGYRLDRLLSFFDPSYESGGATFFSNQLRSIVASAQSFGGPTLPQLVTEQPNEISNYWFGILHSPAFSLTYVLYRFGIYAASCLVLLFAAFLFRMLFAVRKLHDESARLQSLAVLLALGVQAVLYIVYNFGLLSPMAATLPFISFGAQACIVNMGLLGLLLGNYRVKDVKVVGQVGAMREMSQ